MPVSSLLLTIDPAAEPNLRAALATDPRVLIGERVGPRLPLALETADQADDEAAWAWLRGLPGVAWVDLAWISIEASVADARPSIGSDPADSRPTSGLRPTSSPRGLR